MDKRIGRIYPASGWCSAPFERRIESLRQQNWATRQGIIQWLEMLE